MDDELLRLTVLSLKMREFLLIVLLIYQPWFFFSLFQALPDGCGQWLEIWRWQLSHVVSCQECQCQVPHLGVPQQHVGQNVSWAEIYRSEFYFTLQIVYHSESNYHKESLISGLTRCMWYYQATWLNHNYSQRAAISCELEYITESKYQTTDDLARLS